MPTISSTFTEAASGKKPMRFGLSTLEIIFWIIAIDDDRHRREKERREKRERFTQPCRSKPKCPPGPGT